MIKNAIEQIIYIVCWTVCILFNYKVRYYMLARVFFFIPKGKGQSTSGIKKVYKCNCTYPFPFLDIMVHSINRLVFYFGSLWGCSIYVCMDEYSTWKSRILIMPREAFRKVCKFPTFLVFTSWGNGRGTSRHILGISISLKKNRKEKVNWIFYENASHASIYQSVYSV